MFRMSFDGPWSMALSCWRMIGFETFLGSWGRGQDGVRILEELARFGHVVEAMMYSKYTYEVAMAFSRSR